MQSAIDAPRRLGRYVLLGTLGRGGMGEVVRARAFGASGATKELCLKRIHADRLTRPGALERFVDEARVALRLAHGNIVAVFDFGRAGDEHYLAMEWIDGADLRMILGDASAPAPLAPAIAAHVAAEIARALAYAHDQGVVHCDVKPANVIIARTGDVKLTDFGVATAIDATRGGGTRGYVPPEHASGSAATAGTDLYALGVMLIEMLTGERRIDPVGLAPGPLEAIVSRMLDPDPARRPQRASEVARELEAFVAQRRSEDGVAPRDELARRASRAADARHEERASGTYEATASFARDGERAFVEPTAPTASTHESIPPPRRSRRAPAILVSTALALAALMAALFAARPTATRPPSTGALAPASEREVPPFAVDTVLATSSPSESTAIVERSPEPIVIAPPLLPEAPQRATISRPRAAAVAAAPIAVGAAAIAAAPIEPAPAEPPAHLRINAIPWADVELDGRPVGVTPLLDLEVASGQHTLRFVNGPLGVERERTIEVSSGERRDYVVDLE